MNSINTWENTLYASTIKTIQKNTDEDIYDRGLLSDYVKMAPSYIQDDAKRMFELYYKVKYGGKS